jgi:hypothetical protein
MSALDNDLVPVPLGYCPCEGKPHEDGDVVYLYPDLSVPAGIRARAWFVDAMTGELDSPTLQEKIAGLWLEVGVAEWTFLDDDGSPIPVTHENVVRALPYGKGGRLVADKADDLYVDSVITPLAQGLEALSQRGSTSNGRGATSPRTTSTRKPRKPSSTATTAKAPPPG